MGDSDDEYESSGKRRGQSRNKFRNEREDSNNSANGDSVNEMDARKLSKAGGHGDSKDRSHHSSSNSRRRHTNSNFDEDDDEMHHRKYVCFFLSLAIGFKNEFCFKKSMLKNF